MTTLKRLTMSNPAKGQSGDGQQHHKVSAQAQKTAEVQEAGSAKAGAGHPTVLEGKAEAPTEGKGHPKSAASNAPSGATSEAATSSATVGKAEEAAAAAGAAEERHGRGHRKLIVLDHRTLTILDWSRLVALAEFNPTYLHQDLKLEHNSV